MIRVENISKCYHGVEVVSGVSFEVSCGQVVSLIGPNGAGKTTTLEIVEGLRKPDRGEVYIKEILLHTNGNLRKIQRYIGVQLQECSYYERLKIEELVKLFASLYGVSTNFNHVSALLNDYGLPAREYYSNLSAGQKRRLSLLLALLHEPEIIFLDEPTAGLDVQGRHFMWDKIKSLKDEGRTILFATHSMEEVEELADEVLIIDNGSIILRGNPHDLTKKFQDTLEKIFLRETGTGLRD